MYTDSRIRMLQALGALTLGAAVASCTPGTRYSLYNNTTGEITVVIGEHNYLVPSAALVKLEKLQDGGVTIQAGTQKWSYSKVLAPFFALAVGGSYNEKAHAFSEPELGVRRITIQVDSDGKLFVVPPGVTPPVSAPIEQPDGFPLSPMAPNQALNVDARQGRPRAS